MHRAVANVQSHGGLNLLEHYHNLQTHTLRMNPILKLLHEKYKSALGQCTAVPVTDHIASTMTFFDALELSPLSLFSASEGMSS